jgi:hypothetical protein
MSPSFSTELVAAVEGESEREVDVTSRYTCTEDTAAGDTPV